VEESLRYDSPVLGLFRTTTRTVELHDSVIPEGAKVMLHNGAANRDPLVFSDPGRFDVDRDAQELRSHLAFGFGPHVCLGAALSRLEGRIALRQIAERLPGLVLAAPPERVTPFLLWGKRSLPARWTLGE
jgi:cytochrome P450